jgi:hypothetical protein
VIARSPATGALSRSSWDATQDLNSWIDLEWIQEDTVQMECERTGYDPDDDDDDYGYGDTDDVDDDDENDDDPDDDE